MARSYSSTSPRTQALGQSVNNIDLNRASIESNTSSSPLTQPVMHTRTASSHSPLLAKSWHSEDIKFGALPAAHAEPLTSLAPEMPSAGTDELSTSLYRPHSTTSLSETIDIEYTLVPRAMNVHHRDEVPVVVEGEPPAKRFKNAAGRAIASPMTLPSDVTSFPPLQSLPPLQIFSIPEIPPRTAPPVMDTASAAYIHGHRFSAGIVKQLHAYQKQLAETGGFDVEGLIALLAVKPTSFTNGEPERIEFSRELVNLINSTIKRHNKPQGKFDSSTLDRFGLAALEWLSRSAVQLRSSELKERYSNGNPDLYDENVIVRPLFRMMCAVPESRDFILRIYEELDAISKNHLTIAMKIEVLRQWAKGEISLNSAEQEALCTLKVKNTTRAKGLLALIRKYAGVPVDALVYEHVSLDKPLAGANQ